MVLGNYNSNNEITIVSAHKMIVVARISDYRNSCTLLTSPVLCIDLDYDAANMRTFVNGLLADTF